MNILERLKQATGKLVVLRFKDGHTVLARVILVDADRPAEVIYDIVKVIRRGPSQWESVRAGTVAAADPSELEDVTDSDGGLTSQ
jgi:hypothetical protein